MFGVMAVTKLAIGIADCFCFNTLDAHQHETSGSNLDFKTPLVFQRLVLIPHCSQLYQHYIDNIQHFSQRE